MTTTDTRTLHSAAVAAGLYLDLSGSLNQLLAEGLMSELSYMTAEEAERAASLEADLIAAARAEVE